MAQVNHANREAAIQGAITDGGTRNAINAYHNPTNGPNTDIEATYVVVRNGKRGWVALKSNGAGTWTEV